MSGGAWEKIGQKFEEILERDSPATVCHQCGEASPAPDHFTRHVED